MSGFHSGPARLLASANEDRPRRASQIIVTEGTGIFDPQCGWKDFAVSKSGYEIKREGSRTFLIIVITDLTMNVLKDFRESLETGAGSNFSQLAVLQYSGGFTKEVVGHLFLHPTPRAHSGPSSPESGIYLEFETRESRELEPWIHSPPKG